MRTAVYAIYYRYRRAHSNRDNEILERALISTPLEAAASRTRLHCTRACWPLAGVGTVGSIAYSTYTAESSPHFYFRCGRSKRHMAVHVTLPLVALGAVCTASNDPSNPPKPFKKNKLNHNILLTNRKKRYFCVRYLLRPRASAA
jgi:hypothetical protein